LLDSIAGAAQLSEKLGTFSLWWIELAILPFGLISVPILRWCSRCFPSKATELEGRTINFERADDFPSDITS
jgi:hypothetical protein